MTTKPKSGGGKRAAAAQAETNGGARKVDFRGLDLELPPTLSATVAFDLAELEGGSINPQAVVRLLTSMLGKEQVVQIRNKLADDGDSIEKLDEILTGLVESVFEAFGMTAGEAPASEES